MATLEELALAQDVCRYLRNLRRDLRSNAAAYQAALSAGRTAAQVGPVVQADATQYLILLTRLKALIVDDPAKQTKVLNGFAALSVSGPVVQSVYSELRQAAVAQQAADVSTVAAIATAADAVLAGVASYVLLD